MMEFGLIIVILFIGFMLGRKSPTTAYDIHEGEVIVNNAIREQMGNDCFLIPNVTLPTSDGTTQIDQVLVSRKGIFVLESKHYSGIILGDEKSAKWMQVTKWEKRPFQNPLRQNYKHIVELSALLPFIKKNYLYSVVVFSGQSEFGTVMPKNVLHVHQMASHLKGFERDVLTEEQVWLAIGKIQYHRKEESVETDRKHVEDLRKRFRS